MGDGPGGGDGSLGTPGGRGGMGNLPSAGDSRGGAGRTGRSAFTNPVTPLFSVDQTRSAAKAVSAAALPLAGLLLTGSGALDAAEGDPGIGQGVSDAEGGGGVGGGPTARPYTPVLRTQTNAVAPPAPPPAPPPTEAPTIEAIKKADLKRKRVGRPETILTSRGALSTPNVYRPTLLGQ